jgi:hypothetical protein
MEPDRSDFFEMATELESIRPRPRPAFAAALDAQAAEGFPEKRGRRSRRKRAARALGGLSWRRLGPPIGATALAAIVVATAAIVISESGSESGRELVSPPLVGTTKPRPVPSQFRPAGGNPNYSEPAPEVGHGGAKVAPSSAAAGGVGTQSAGVPSSSVGPYAARIRARDVERSARVVLAVDPSEVRSAAGDVLAVVHEFDGIVLRSATRTLGEGRAYASFDLLLPSRRLPDALAALSEIGPVRSRSDASVDVTAPTIGLRERVRDTRARVDSLLSRLEGATTDAERESIEAGLSSERGRLARLRSRLSAMERRTHFARVSVRVASDPEAGATGGSGWGVGDALRVAGRILAVFAGVTVVALAILVPIGLILFLSLAGHRAWVRRSRERALGREAATGSD